MSLNTFWKHKRPLKRESHPSYAETFHVYITKHSFEHDDGREFLVETNYGELPLCANINLRRAPIATHRVEEVVYREPYEHCEKCMSDMQYLAKMKFGTITVLR